MTIDPANFVSVIDNPYLPLTPGSVWTYRETDAEGAVSKVVVTVTNDTKEILGVATVVVHDVLTEDGVTVEDTFDWYAQDRAGNVWYFGEATKEFSDAGVDTTGSWEAGVDGAQPGVVMPAAPQPGLSYRQEYLAGEAEDAATVLSLDERAEVAAGTYEGLVLTKDFTPVEPDILEYKWYASGVGLVLAITVSGGSDREELTKFHARDAIAQSRARAIAKRNRRPAVTRAPVIRRAGGEKGLRPVRRIQPQVGEAPAPPGPGRCVIPLCERRFGQPTLSMRGT